MQRPARLGGRQPPRPLHTGHHTRMGGNYITNAITTGTRPSPGDRLKVNFCSHCGQPVTLRVPEGDNRPRHVCASCGTIHYRNLKVVVVCVPEWQGRILLCRQAIEPRLGYWTIPAGEDRKFNAPLHRSLLRQTGLMVCSGEPEPAVDRPCPVNTAAGTPSAPIAGRRCPYPRPEIRPSPP
ncbi:MAG TPA: NUDIX hydrolase [Steroidobacteraceae bacterium]|nr:NUDIX hydrolase [Steroidobacteraceae bacterium]